MGSPKPVLGSAPQLPGPLPVLSHPESLQGSLSGQLWLGGCNMLCSLTWQRDCPLAGVVNAKLVIFTVYHGFVVVV